MIVTYAFIFIFFTIFTVLILYVFSTYFFPRKLDEIAEMIKKGQIKLAIRKLNDILAKDDRNNYAHYLLAEANIADKNYDYAVVEYKQVIKYGLFDDKVREVEVREKLAEIFRNQKKMADAKKEYLILTQIDSANYKNYFELGKIFFEANVLDKASEYLKKAITINGKHAESYYYLGQVYYRGGVNPDAKQAFINAIKNDSSNNKAHYFLGLVLRAEGDHEWAIKEFEIAQKAEDIRSKCFLAKGTCYYEMEQYSKAIVEFERGLKVTSASSDTALNMRYFLASCHEKMRDMASAIENWEKIYEINKKFRDVEEKLRQNAEFRQDDHIKDFMIATLSNFEHTCRKMVEVLNLEVLETKVMSDTDIEIYVAEKDDMRRNTRRMYRLVRIVRTTQAVQDAFLRTLYETMKPRNAQRIMVITTGEFSQPAIEFANTRPIELIGKTKIIELLKKVHR